MDAQALAARLAASDPDKALELLAAHPHLVGPRLAQALNALYIKAISGAPPLAAGAAAALELLAAHSPDPEVRAFADWTAGMATLQIEGRSEAAIVRIDAAAAAFAARGQAHRAATTQASKLFALAMLGRYTEAIAVGEAARDQLLAHGDRLAAGKIEQNLGNIYHRRDQYAQAEQHYRAAAAHFVAGGDRRMLAFAENGLANVLALQQRVREAGRLYEQAMEHAAAAGATVTQAEIECNLGCLALFSGRYDQALALLERSRRRYAELEMPHQSLIAELELADAYLELNLAAEAAAICARAAPALAKLGMRAEQARAMLSHGRACLFEGRLAEGRALCAQAGAIYGGEGNQVGVALAALAEARIDFAGGDFTAAATLAATVEGVFAGLGATGHLLLARWLQGESLRMLGRAPEAEGLLRATLAAALPDAPHIAHRCLTSLGLLAHAASRPAEAEAHLRQAADLVDTLRAPLPGEEFRAAFVVDKLTPFLALARLCLEDAAADRRAEAFGYIERARARALLEMMAAEPRAAPAPVGPDEAALHERLEAAHEELNWCYSQLNRLAEPDGLRDLVSVAALQSTARVRETQVQELARRLRQAGQDGVVATAPLDLEKLQRSLGQATALVEYATLDGELLAFVVTGEGVAVARGLAPVEEVAAAVAQLHFQIGALRHGAGIDAAFGEQLTRRAQHHLRRLHTAVLAPLLPLLGARRLVIVPHRELYYVPFHALHDGEGYVVEGRAVSYAPSARIFQQVSEGPPRAPRRALLVSVPDARTPALGDEVAALTPLFPETTALAGPAATLAALRAHAPAADLLHMACHGHFRPDAPLFSALQLADGNLTVRDAYELGLGCELAVLSACDTGISRVAPGDELFGLARGFLAAGAASLIVSLWSVDDESAKELMVRFYRAYLAGSSPAEALRAAQLAIRAAHPHPFYWAPFLLIGRP